MIARPAPTNRREELGGIHSSGTKRDTMSEEAIDSTKTFKVSRWGTIERSATARNEKPAGLGVKEHHIKGRTEVCPCFPSHATTALNHPGMCPNSLHNTL